LLPSQLEYPDEQTGEHAPPEQLLLVVWLSWQTDPHPLQLYLSVWKFRHVPEQQ
jgi:hypothetical protein